MTQMSQSEYEDFLHLNPNPLLKSAIKMANIIKFSPAEAEQSPRNAYSFENKRRDSISDISPPN